MEELKINETLTEEKVVAEENNVISEEDKDAEKQEFSQVLMQLNEEYTKENEEPTEKTEGEKVAEEPQIQPELPVSKEGANPKDKHEDALDVEQQSFFANDDKKEEQGEEKAQNAEKNDNGIEKKQQNAPIIESEEEKLIKKAFAKQAEQEEKGSTEKKDDPDAFCEVEYKQIKLQKIYNKIAYELTDPALTVTVLKERILDAENYLFESYMLLTSKIKPLRKALKSSRKMCAVIGLGESTALAKKWEIRQAKAQKVSEIQVVMPLSIIKEGKKRLIIKEFTEYRKLVGDKIAFTVAIDGENLTNDEFFMAMDCALLAKPKKVYLKNTEKISQAKLLFAVKACADKCKIQVDFAISNSAEIKRHNERGIDLFVVKNAVALAESIKHEED